MKKFIFLLIVLIVFSCLFSSVMAVEEKEVYVDMYEGFTSYDIDDGGLFNDFFHHYGNTYSLDSPDFDGYTPIEPGTTYSGDLGWVPVNYDGERIHSIDFQIVNFENYSVDEIIAREGDIDRTDFDEKGNYTTAWEMTYGENSATLTIVFNDDGTFSIDIPSDLPKGQWAIAGWEDIDSDVYEMIMAYPSARYFLQTGGTSNSDDKNYKYYSINTSYSKYRKMDSVINAHVSSSLYNVSTAIPTSENVNGGVSGISKCLYDILVRKTELKAGIRNVTIKTRVYYRYLCTDTTCKDYVEGETHYHNKYSSYKTWNGSDKKITYEAESSGTYYDVTSASYYPVVKASLSGKFVNFSKNVSGITGPSASPFKKIECKLPEISSSTYTYSYNLGTRNKNAGFSSGDQERAYSAAKNKLIRIVNDAVKVQGTTNFSFEGLRVTTKALSGNPRVGTTSASGSGYIQSNTPNGAYGHTGSATYSNGYTVTAAANKVKVHTPVVNNSYISNISKFFNQKITIDNTKQYIQLDGNFTITIPNNGTHNNYKGYGTRVYNSGQGVNRYATTWAKIKDVKMPFDSYVWLNSSGTQKAFVKANTWLSEAGTGINTTTTTYTFTVPVWVTEGVYNIETRVVAENATNYNLVETGINSNSNNYVATKSIPVEIVGKIYDLRVSSSNDPDWFNKIKNGYVTAENFPFGQQGQNIISQYKYAPKIGYSVVFDFKTKGRKSNNIDISVQPEGFYFVSKNGGAAQEVDLYYSTTSEKNIKIEPSDTRIPLNVRISDAFMKVPSQELVDSNRIYKNEIGYVYNYTSPVNVGTFAQMKLPHSLRLCFNNFKEYVNALYSRTESQISNDAGSKDRVIGSVGHWYVGYRLPASTMAITKGSNIRDAINSDKLLTDGYILVKFNIKTKFDTWDYLWYKGPEVLNEGTLSHNWTKPYNPSNPSTTVDITLPNGKPANVPEGTVAMFEAGIRSSDDYETAGTH